jgi:hypothetical protein
MVILAGVAGLVLISLVLWDGFESIILPHRVTRQIRLARFFYRLTWRPWSAMARRIRNNNRRENMLSYFGPLSIILLLIVWAAGIIIGFALIQLALGSQIAVANGKPTFGADLYMSGTTFFTLGFGDVVPIARLAKVATVAEGGLGLGFLAMIISYLPALYSSFSSREVDVTMLDARAGSPPTAFELLRRNRALADPATLEHFLQDWERWSAKIMESHLSYPVLAYYRSQHENQSWVTALAMILDLSTLIQVGIDGLPTETARLTFAMARHACVDLTQIFNLPPLNPPVDRLPPMNLARLRAGLTAAGMSLQDSPHADRRLGELRAMYEPYIYALARYLLAALPPWMPEEDLLDDWQITGWE